MRVLMTGTALVLMLGTAQAADYYVSPAGSDAGSGVQASPFKTILHADGVVGPGDVVHVLPGTYPGDLATHASGTAAARIKYVSDARWGAKISGGTDTLWWSTGAYVDIVGFDLDGSSATGNMGFYLTGSYSSAQGNHVHGIHKNAACSNQGAAGIEAEGYYGASHIDIIGNLVHDVGPAGCGFDHGIYMIAPFSRALNNVVYNVSGFGVHGWHDDNHETIANNTLVNNGGGVLLGGGDYYKTTGPSDYNVVANNIVVGNDSGFNESGDLGTHNLYTNNLVWNNAVVSSAWITGSLVNTVRSDPVFAATGGYQLQGTSPAINMAAAAYAPATDMVGTPRPQGAGYDIGAYEYAGTVVVAPTASLSASTGSPVTLTWGSTDAVSCAGTHFSTGGAASGSAAVSPTVTTTYSVACSGPGGSAGASVTVTRKRRRH